MTFWIAGALGAAAGAVLLALVIASARKNLADSGQERQVSIRTSRDRSRKVVGIAALQMVAGVGLIILVVNKFSWTLLLMGSLLIVLGSVTFWRVKRVL